MLNILVPTDFSVLAKVAVQYAVKIANVLNGQITLLHVVTIAEPTRLSMHQKTKKLEDDLISFAEKDIHKLIQEIYKTEHPKRQIAISVVKSLDVGRAIEKEVKRLKAGLIVMGTKGASGLKKAVVGSNTTAVIEFSKVPVLAVPDKAQFRGFKDIIYASDLKNIERELRMLKSYAESFGAIVHVVHVERDGKNIEEVEEKMDKAIKKVGFKNACSIVLVDKNVEGAIDQYINTVRAGLLTMFTHDPTFYEKLFDRSMTRKMAFQSLVPLLAFKQRN